MFFFGALFFLLGVLGASGGARDAVWWVSLSGIVAALMARWWQGRGWNFTRWERNGWLTMAALLLFMPAGAFYYTADDVHFSDTPLPEGKRTLRAEIVSLPTVKEGTQDAVLELADSELRVLAKLPAYPAFLYGDKLTFVGRIEEPFSDAYRAYLAKERVRGVVAFPKIVEYEANTLSVRGALYALREKIVDAFRLTLPPREAALMAGLAVGAREDFSEDFRNAMAKSGTTHLVALSGYNISVVVMAAMGFFLLFFPRRFAFVATLAVVLSFVLMTGAEASVVRAAVMGGIALLAKHMGRRMDVRNAILFAALIMVLINPKVLAFDLGFQLSFLALLGLVYVRPALDRLIGWERGRGVFSWRENLTTTAAAQLAVAPLLIHSFGSVSLSSLFANLVVLEVVPLAMGLGFVLAAVVFVSLTIGHILGFLVFLVLRFQTFIIELFAMFSVPFAPALSLAMSGFYYLVLIAFAIYVHRTRPILRRV